MKRTDVLKALMGTETFIDDYPFKGLYATFVRSDYPHADFKVDGSGVTQRGAIFLDGLPGVMASGRARYQGEPLGLILSEDQYEGWDLRDYVVVDYSPLPPVTGIEEALKGEVLVFEDLKTNVVDRREFQYGSAHSTGMQMNLDLYWSRSSGNPIETFGALVIPREWGLEVVSNAQAPQYIAKQVSDALGVKVVHVPVRHGGSFGSKFSLGKYMVTLGAAALKTGRPVKWIETRTEHLLASNSSGPERKFRVDVNFNREGVINDLQVEIWEDIGASRYPGGQATKPTGFLTGPYAIPHVRYIVNQIATNKNPPGAFRGAGTPPHTWMLERVVDAVAGELGLDPVEVRRRNLMRDFPFDTGYSLVDLGKPQDLLDMALSRRDVFSLDGKEGYAVGVAVSTDPSSPNGSESVVLSTGNGKVRVGLGFAPEGQGNEHAITLMVSRELGIPIEDVEVVFLNSDQSPPSFGPGGSRMAVFSYGAVQGAVEELKARARRTLGVTDVTTDQLLGTPMKVEYTYELSGKYRFNAYPFAVNLALLKLEEGRIRHVKQVVYIDPGSVIDQDLVREQVMGGTYTGISIALHEAYRYDSNGMLRSTTLVDYGLPYASDIGEIEVNVVSSPSSTTKGGLKGIGEIPVGVAAAAVTSAAERLLGRKLRKVPIEPSE